jgi:hypothetical protein
VRSHPACTSKRWVTKDIITHSLPLLVYGLIRSPTAPDLIKDNGSLGATDTCACGPSQTATPLPLGRRPPIQN